MCRICKSLWWYTSSTHSEAKYAAASFGTPYNDPQRARWRIGSLISTSKQIRNDKIEATACELNKKKQKTIIHNLWILFSIYHHKPKKHVISCTFCCPMIFCCRSQRLSSPDALDASTCAFTCASLKRQCEGYMDGSDQPWPHYKPTLYDIYIY